MRRLGVPGETVKRTTSETLDKSSVTDTLFGPIEDRAGAEDLARLLGVAVLVLAAVEAVFALRFGAGAVALAVLEAGLGCVVWRRKSAAAAVMLLAVALAASLFLLREIFRLGGAVAAWALAVTLAGVWVGARAVQCAIAFRRLSAASDGGPSAPPRLL